MEPREDVVPELKAMGEAAAAGVSVSAGSERDGGAAMGRRRSRRNVMGSSRDGLD